ncbi:MAG: 3'-_5' exoribonuclease Bsu YhaM [uncultured Rubrobacteraceae bacterium]|uniref:3'->5' exoribonuclease Bsu YhaM n=1 Tax=uncultured Rubrobacteraceae bacterium TaxID=349277 RepID=A0A6J4Q4K4_9ACTN|nr:MAG: 3'->5' exoribonuclease Bsu YhaM [uncultured Rubrobacteraceae bacterium]
MSLRSTFLATETVVRPDSRGSPYLSTKLVDKTGSVDARMWRLPAEFSNGLSGPEYVYVEGNAHEYRGMLQVKVERMRVLSKNEVEKEDYLPATENDRESLAEELIEAGRALEDPHLRELFARMVADEELWESFCAAPAAKAMHHARLGGLLEHSVCCLRVAQALAELYPVDKSLLIFGAVFHDVGKTKELSWENGSFAYTTEGRLQGHVILGDRIVASHVSQTPGFPEELALQLSHLMLSHQGEKEYGSPEQPKTLEALLVNLLDNLDARAAMFLESTRNVALGGWSHHENPLRRGLYVPDRTAGP